MKLKPCPFCGEKEKLNIESKYAPRDGYYKYVECNGCWVKTTICWEHEAEFLGFPNAEEHTITLWNTRKETK